MRFRTAVFSLLASSALLAGCARPQPMIEGDYSNVTYNEESGDNAGYDLQIRLGPTPRVLFQDCESVCKGGGWFPTEIKGNRLSFIQVLPILNEDRSPGEHRTRYQVERQGVAMILTSPDYPGFREVLMPDADGEIHP